MAPDERNLIALSLIREGLARVERCDLLVLSRHQEHSGLSEKIAASKPSWVLESIEHVDGFSDHWHWANQPSATGLKVALVAALGPVH